MKKLFILTITITVVVSMVMLMGVMTTESQGTKLIHEPSDPPDAQIIYADQELENSSHNKSFLDFYEWLIDKEDGMMYCKE